MENLIDLSKATCRNEKYTEGLKKLIQVVGDSVENMVEIGSYQGESTKIFAENLHKIKKLYAVDPWINGYCQGDVCSDEYSMEIVENNFDVRTCKFSFIVKKKMYSKEFVKEIEDNSLDFVYIDGDHTYNGCKSDIEMWLPKVKKGGYIGGHDYLSQCFIGVVNAVNEAFGSPDLIFEDTSWLKKIN